MSLFGIKPVTESTEITSPYNYVGEATELTEILFEAAKDIHQIQAGLFVADIMMESQVVYEGASEEILVEGVMKDFFTRIIEALRKLLGKIKAWFVKVYKSIEVFFLPGEKFVKKYEKEILAKDTTGFEYKGYKYDKTVVDALYDLKDVKKGEVSVFNSVDGLFDAFNVKDLLVDGKFTSESLNKAEEKTLKEYDNSADNISEHKKTIMDNALGGEKEDIENFSVYSVTEMISFIKGKTKLVASLKKAEGVVSKNLDNTIKGMENLKKTLKDEEKAKYSSSISNVAALARYVANIHTAQIECAITVAKKQNGEFVGVLKSLMRYKGTKEGYSYMNEGRKSTSLFESAMGLI